LPRLRHHAFSPVAAARASRSPPPPPTSLLYLLVARARDGREQDGASPSLRTTELLEHNQHVMLPEAAKKIRYLRSDFKRRMEAEGKAMAPADRAKAVEAHLRKVREWVAEALGVAVCHLGQGCS
jgi:hypothetical protein